MDLRSQIRDSDAMKSGEWLPLGPEFGAVEVKVRAMAGHYNDTLAKLTRAAARKHGGENNIPSDEAGKLITEAFITTSLVDARSPDAADNIDGEPINLTTITALMREPGAVSLVNAAMACSARVGFVKAETAEEAAGN